MAQQVLQFARNTAHYVTDTGRIRIPDGVVGNIFIEVKNAAYLANTSQMKDLVDLAKRAGEPLVLVIREGGATQLSRQLLQLVEQGLIILAPILPAS